jgi:hypothetical protein
MHQLPDEHVALAAAMLRGWQVRRSVLVRRQQRRLPHVMAQVRHGVRQAGGRSGDAPCHGALAEGYRLRPEPGALSAAGHERLEPVGRPTGRTLVEEEVVYFLRGTAWAAAGVSSFDQVGWVRRRRGAAASAAR